MLNKKCDYHTHPNLTNEPHRADAFIESAINQGFDEICFTDHMPLSISDAGDRIKKGNIEKYCLAVKKKAKEYESKIVIKTGIEVDYHPDFIDEIEYNLNQGEFDLVLGATHFHIPGYNILSSNLNPNEYARISFENSLKAIKSGYFDIIAHLDLQRWVYTLPKRFPMKKGMYDHNSNIDILKKIMIALEETGVKLEINSLAFLHKVSNSDVYPSKDIMNLSYDYNIDYSFGSDAHSADWVGHGYDLISESIYYKKAFSK
ncbi:MAG: histidinol-phosphatase HisJ family protein [Clostridiales bacterium]|nr:histidinol-phosphatase HisJ family protein [Clostridiales bacterium]